MRNKLGLAPGFAGFRRVFVAGGLTMGFVVLGLVSGLSAAAQFPADTLRHVYVLRPDRVFDGEQLHEGWQVIVSGHVIVGIGPAGETTAPAKAIVLELRGATLLPG